MLAKLKALLPTPRRALRERIDEQRELLRRSVHERRAMEALLAEAYFRDKSGRMLPKGQIPKHLRKLTGNP